MPARAGDPQDLLHRARRGAAHHAAAGRRLAGAAGGQGSAAGVPDRAGSDRRSADRRGPPPAGPLRPRPGALARPGHGRGGRLRPRSDHRRQRCLRAAGQPGSGRVVAVAAGAVPRLRHGGPCAVRATGAVAGRERAHPVQHQRVPCRGWLDAPSRACPGADGGGGAVPAQHRRLRHRAGLRADGDAVRRGGRARGAGPVPLPGRLAGSGGGPPDRRRRLGPAVHADPHPGQRPAHVAEPRGRPGHRRPGSEPHLHRADRRGVPYHRRLRGRPGCAGRRTDGGGGGFRPRLRARQRGAADRGSVRGGGPPGLAGRGGPGGPADGRRDAGAPHRQRRPVLDRARRLDPDPGGAAVAERGLRQPARPRAARHRRARRGVRGGADTRDRSAARLPRAGRLANGWSTWRCGARSAAAWACGAIGWAT